MKLEWKEGHEEESRAGCRVGATEQDVNGKKIHSALVCLGKVGQGRLPWMFSGIRTNSTLPQECSLASGAFNPAGRCVRGRDQSRSGRGRGRLAAWREKERQRISQCFEGTGHAYHIHVAFLALRKNSLTTQLETMMLTGCMRPQPPEPKS